MNLCRIVNPLPTKPSISPRIVCAGTGSRCADISKLQVRSTPWLHAKPAVGPNPWPGDQKDYEHDPWRSQNHQTGHVSLSWPIWATMNRLFTQRQVKKKFGCRSVCPLKRAVSPTAFQISAWGALNTNTNSNTNYGFVSLLPSWWVVAWFAGPAPCRNICLRPSLEK